MSGGGRIRFSRVLTVYRAMRELTMRDLAREIGISAATLCRIENGTGQADGPTMVKLFAWIMSTEKEPRP